MTRIDFYQITNTGKNADSLVCRLCQKAWEQRQKVLLLTSNQEQTQHLDRLLWVENDDSFIPHDTEEQDGIITPVLVTHEADPRGERELLINLNSEIPLYFAQFERVIELVTDDNKKSAREHYSFYQERGYQLEHIKL